MEIKLELDWKSFLALGVSVASIILATKLNDDDAAKVLTLTVDACKDYVTASNSSC